MHSSIKTNMINLAVTAVTVADKSVSFGMTKSGDGITVVSQKHLGEITGLKGAALKRAHFEYRLEAGKMLNAGLSAGMAAGEIIAKTVVPTKAGGIRATFDRVSKLNSPSQKTAKQALQEMAAKLVAAGKFTSIEEALVVLA